MRQLTGPTDCGIVWDDRPFAEGVAAAYGMSWWRRLSGTNAGVIPASLGVTQHGGGLGRVCLEVWPESHWPGFALLQVDVLQSYTA